jgi:hypothetical protein
MSTSPGLPDFFLGPKAPKQEKYIKWPQTVPNGHKIYNVTVNITNGHKIYQHCPFQGPPKYTQIGLFGIKISHLATMSTTLRSTKRELRRTSITRSPLKLHLVSNFFQIPLYAKKCDPWKPSLRWPQSLVHFFGYIISERLLTSFWKLILGFKFGIGGRRARIRLRIWQNKLDSAISNVGAFIQGKNKDNDGTQFMKKTRTDVMIWKIFSRQKIGKKWPSFGSKQS